MKTKIPVLFAAAALFFTVGGAAAAPPPEQSWLWNLADDHWNTSSPNWDAGVPWSQGNSAFFGGTGEAVTLTEPIQAHDLTFDPASWFYTLDGSPLSVSGAIRVQDSSAVIRSNLSGPGLTKEGPGLLQLSGVSSFSGPTRIIQGTLRIAGATDSGGGDVPISAAKLEIISGGSFTTTGSVGATSALSALKVDDGGALTTQNLLLGAKPVLFTVDGTIHVTENMIVAWPPDGIGMIPGASLDGTGTIRTASFHCRKFSHFRLGTELTLTDTGLFCLGDMENSGGGVEQGAGTVNLTTDTPDAIRIGFSPGANSSYVLKGGVLNARNVDTVIGWDADGRLDIIGGTANLKGVRMGNTAAHGDRDGDALLIVQGGRLNLGSGGIPGGGNGSKIIYLGQAVIGAWGGNWTCGRQILLIDSPGGTTFHTADSDDGVTPRVITLSNNLGGMGGIRKEGAGVLELTAENVFGGDTVLTEGVLFLGHARALQYSALLTGDSGERAVLFAAPGVNTYPIRGLAGNLDLDIGENSLSIGPAPSGPYTGVIRGAGGVRLSAGTFKMSGVQAYSGQTLISGGCLEVSGGPLSLADSVLHLDPSQDPSPAVDIRSGNLTVRGLSGSSSPTREIVANGPHSLVISTPEDECYEYGGAFADGTSEPDAVLSLVKTGPGAQVLSGASSHSGGTRVHQGILLLANTSGSATGSGPLIVEENGVLAGYGHTASHVTVFGAVEPGVEGLPGGESPAIGSLNLTGGVTLHGTAHMDIGKSGTVLSSDKILSLFGTIQLGGVLEVRATGDPPAAGDSFLLFRGVGLSGSFQNLLLPPLPLGLAWKTEDLPTTGFISVVQAPAMDIEEWRQLHFGTTENSGAAANDADPDADAVPNLLEYALGLDPNSPTPLSLRVVVDTETGYLRLSARFNPQAVSAALRVEVSSDLLLWDSTEGAAVHTEPSPADELVVRDLTLVSSGGRRFIRLLAEQQ